jgi:hypothetical protein
MTNIGTLADRAVLIKFTKRTFTKYRKDKKATAVVDNTFGVHSGNFNKKLLAGAIELISAESAATRAYMYYFDNTSPWLDEEGVRMLRSDRILDFTQELNKLMEDADKKFDALEAKWPELVDKDMERLGPLGNREDYPVSIRDKYELVYSLRPVPVAGDFRIELPQEEIDKMDAALHSAEQIARQDTIKELLAPMATAVNKLLDYTAAENEGRRTRFHDSVILNIEEQIKLARKKNIMQDAAIDAMCDEMYAALTPYLSAIDQIKENVVVRESVQNKLNELITKGNSI